MVEATESKYWDMLANDEIIKTFNQLHKECYELSYNIRKKYTAILALCNDCFANLLSGNRKVLRTHSKEDDLDTASYVGLGTKGFGYSYYGNSNLYYGNRDIYYNKEFILEHSKIFKSSVKKSMDFRNRYDAGIQVLKTLHNMENLGQYILMDIVLKSYVDDDKYNSLEVITRFFDKYRALFVIRFTDSGGSNHNLQLETDNIEQDVMLYHTYETINKLLTKHKKELQRIDRKVDQFKKGKDYIKLRDLVEMITLTKTL